MVKYWCRFRILPLVVVKYLNVQQDSGGHSQRNVFDTNHQGKGRYPTLMHLYLYQVSNYYY